MRKILSISKQISTYLFIILFVYAALSKLLDFENFKIQLAQSPLLSAYATYIAYVVVIGELLTALLLCFRKTLTIGLYLFLGFMVSFSVYIYLILNHSPFVPCSCGGVLEKMGWKEHLWFNVLFCLLALFCIFFINKESSVKKHLLYSSIICILSSAIVIALFLSSEHTMKKENPFVRRFLPHPIDKAEYLDLKLNSYYIAGLTDDTLYLGNYTAPLLIKALPMDLTNSKDHMIKLDETQHSFRNLTVRIQNKEFYVSDGTVPIIYKGNTSDWKAKSHMEKKVFFSLLQPLSNNLFLFRSQQASNGEHILGRLNITETTQFELYENALQKQIDGVFDTDGQLTTDIETQQGIYTYYYRNQYLVYNPTKNKFVYGKTIDTTNIAQIKITTLKNGEQIMNVPPNKINIKNYAFNGLLYINSGLLGRNEPKKMWNQAIIIDVYAYNKNEYRYSFYAYDHQREKIHDFALNHTYFFGLVGKSLVRYMNYLPEHGD